MKTKIVLFISIALMIVITIGGVIILFSAFTAKNNIEPEIKYAEFPFSLTYKVGNETITVDHTYVCEFKGIGWDTGRGFYREWDGYVKETGLENVLIVEDSKRQIFCRVGDPRYYMEDLDALPWKNKSLSPPHLYAVKKTSDFDSISVEEIKLTYNIEILSWSFSQPVENHQGG